MAFALALLAGWLGVCWRRGGGSGRSHSGVRHGPKFRQIVPGAVCAQHHSTQRLPL